MPDVLQRDPWNGHPCAPQIQRRAHARPSRGVAREAIFIVQTAEDRRGDDLRLLGKAVTGGHELIRVGQRLWDAWSQTGVRTTAIDQRGGLTTVRIERQSTTRESSTRTARVSGSDRSA